MPSYSRQRSPSPTAIRVQPGTPPKAVAFPLGSSPVTSVSRPLSNAERWTLYHFESHARLCETCLDPYEVHRADSRLCLAGHKLGQDVASVLYSKHRARDVYDASTRASRKPVKVELPHDYEEVRSLLRAMERSLRHQEQRPIISFDRNYHVSERTSPARRLSYSHREPSRERSRELTPTPKRSSSTSRSPPRSTSRSSERRRPEIVDWPQKALSYDVRAPPSTWKHNTSRPQSYPPYYAAHNPWRHITHHFQSPNTASRQAEASEQRTTSSRSTASTPSKTSNAAQLPTTRQLAQEFRPAPEVTPAAPFTPPRQTRAMPEPDAPRSRRFSTLGNDGNKRASWYGGEPYETQLREPKKPPEQAQRQARRYSALWF